MVASTVAGLLTTAEDFWGEATTSEKRAVELPCITVSCDPHLAWEEEAGGVGSSVCSAGQRGHGSGGLGERDGGVRRGYSVGDVGGGWQVGVETVVSMTAVGALTSLSLSCNSWETIRPESLSLISVGVEAVSSIIVGGGVVTAG